jgi:hypothetical protein
VRRCVFGRSMCGEWTAPAAADRFAAASSSPDSPLLLIISRSMHDGPAHRSFRPLLALALFLVGGVRGRRAAGAVAPPRRCRRSRRERSWRATPFARYVNRALLLVALLGIPFYVRASGIRRWADVGVDPRRLALAAAGRGLRAGLLLARGGVRDRAGGGGADAQPADPGAARRAVRGRAGDGAVGGGDRGAALPRGHLRRAAAGDAVGRGAAGEQRASTRSCTSWRAPTIRRRSWTGSRGCSVLPTMLAGMRRSRAAWCPRS